MENSRDTASATRHGWIPVFVLCLNFGVVFFDRNALNFLMPFVSSDLKLSNFDIGLLSAALSLTWALSGFFISAASDRANSRKPMLIAAILCFSVCSFLSGLAVSFATLLGARLLMGAAEGPILPLSQSLVASSVPVKRRGLAMGLVQNFGSNLLGSFVAPIVLVGISTWMGWRIAFFLSGVPGLICAALVWRFVHDCPADKGGQEREKLSLSAAFAYRNVLVCSVLSTLVVGYMAVTYTFLPLYLTRISGYSTGEMSVLISALGLAAATSGIVVPMLSDRIGRKPVIVLMPLLGCLLPIATLVGPADPWILGAFLFAGWFIIGTLSLIMATVPSETVSLSQVATALAIIMGAGEIFGGVGMPIFSGWIADTMGLGGVMWTLIALSGASAVSALYLIETHSTHTRRRQHPPLGPRAVEDGI
ncbi:MFS transporter [Sphingobium sp. YG1]|uniref:MFS transporter n=1 Tax=Sphingobium sp. YG1 TaxID=2082188 RepID=UPI000DBB8A0C|nr:MFS transporter [Sphingobium sp. YG1]BBD01504.1 hypothetical protein YGS_C1P2759 [Sphingobium sp. YG1]